MKLMDNLIYTLLSACLLAGCKDSESKELERMQATGYTSGDTRLSHSRKRTADTPSSVKRSQGQGTGNYLSGDRAERLPVH